MNLDQLGEEYFKAPKYSCFSIIFAAKKNDTEKIQKHKFNILSSNLSQTAFKVVCYLTKVFNSNEFIELGITDLIVFFDGAKHNVNKVKKKFIY
jgi:hypothetical protein